MGKVDERDIYVSSMVCILSYPTVEADGMTFGEKRVCFMGPKGI